MALYEVIRIIYPKWNVLPILWITIPLRWSMHKSSLSLKRMNDGRILLFNLTKCSQAHGLISRDRQVIKQGDTKVMTRELKNAKLTGLHMKPCSMKFALGPRFLF